MEDSRFLVAWRGSPAGLGVLAPDRRHGGGAGAGSEHVLPDEQGPERGLMNPTSPGGPDPRYKWTGLAILLLDSSLS